MTKYDLEYENAKLKNDLYSLQLFKNKWYDLAIAIEQIIRDEIDQRHEDL